MSAVVMELKKELAALNARLSNDEVGAFRSCLCAIAARLQSEEAAATLSLAEWWQWLDDEGYERERFAAALRHICQSSLSEPAWTELQSDVHCMQARPEGLPELCQHVQERFKTLASTMERLEACAQAEQHALEATAGGMSKKGALITAGAVYFGGMAISGIVAGVIIRRSQKRLEARFEPRVEIAHQDEERQISRTEEKITAKVNTHLQDCARLDREELLEYEMQLPVNNGYWCHSKEINQAVRSLPLPDGATIKPLFKTEDGLHYVVRSGGREMVKIAVEGQEFLFYKSTGFAGKDPDKWPIGQWYPVNGKGARGWINKFDASPDYYGSSTLREIGDRLGLIAKSETYLDDELNKLADHHDELIREGINKGLTDVAPYSRDIPKNLIWKSEGEMLKRSLPLVIKERYPLAYQKIGKAKFNQLAETLVSDNEKSSLAELKYLFKDPVLASDAIINDYGKLLAKELAKVEKRFATSPLYESELKNAVDISNLWLKINLKPQRLLAGIHNKLRQDEEKLAKKAFARERRAITSDLLPMVVEEEQARMIGELGHVEQSVEIRFRKRLITRADHAAGQLEHSVKATTTTFVDDELGKASVVVREGAEAGEATLKDEGRALLDV